MRQTIIFLPRFKINNGQRNIETAEEIWKPNQCGADVPSAGGRSISCGRDARTTSLHFIFNAISPRLCRVVHEAKAVSAKTWTLLLIRPAGQQLLRNNRK